MAKSGEMVPRRSWDESDKWQSSHKRCHNCIGYWRLDFVRNTKRNGLRFRKQSFQDGNEVVFNWWNIESRMPSFWGRKLPRIKLLLPRINRQGWSKICYFISGGILCQDRRDKQTMRKPNHEVHPSNWEITRLQLPIKSKGITNGYKYNPIARRVFWLL